VNEASSLIQSAAHEDANIIFGAVLDEKMGEEVKITVIATGFREQMPERRARMLTVEETPVVSVPVVAPDAWMNEPPAVTKPAGAQPPARFLSEVEEQRETEKETAFFFASSKPAVATTVTFAEPEDRGAAGATENKAGADPMAAVAGPPFDEDTTVPARSAAGTSSDEELQTIAPGLPGETGANATSLFSEGEEEAERELDVPAFMRRLRL